MGIQLKLLMALILGATLASRGAQQAGREQYALIELAVLPGAEIAAGHALNRHGMVAGSGYTMQDKSIGKPLLWIGGELKELSPLPGNDAGHAYGINDSGETCGFSRFKFDRGEGQHACYWTAYGAIHDLGTLGGEGGTAQDINNRRQIVGAATRWNLKPFQGKDLRTEWGMRAFLWEKGEMRDLGVLPGHAWSEAKAISENGLIAGTSSDGGQVSRAVLWQNGKITDLGIPKTNESSTAYDVNSAGQVVGVMRGAVARAFLRDETGVKDLGAPPGFEENAAMAINEHAQVVGCATTGAQRSGWVWSGGRFIDLNDLTTKGSAWRIVEAWDINDRGDILARAMKGNLFRTVVLRRLQ